jgi:RHS repeat-associated protein
MTLPNGVETDYSYDKAGQVTAIEHTQRKAKKPFAFAEYAYDKAGNRTAMKDADGQSNYAYDNLYRLTQAAHSDGKTTSTETFSYDAVGNRLSDDKISDYRYDAANRMLENSKYVYTYDKNGNLTGKVSPETGEMTKFAYTSTNQLKEVDMPDGTKVNYTYDVAGRRTQKSITKNNQTNTTTYIYDGQDIIAELDSNGHPIATYTNGPGIDQPLMMTKYEETDSTATAKNYYYHADALGSITALTNDSGAIVEKVSYNAYGEPTLYDANGQKLTQSQAGNTRLFTAREYDNETGMFYYRARYYDQSTGRFIQQDPKGLSSGTVNLYQYATDNPMFFLDPFGTCNANSSFLNGVINFIGGFGNGAAANLFKIGSGFYDTQSAAYKAGNVLGTTGLITLGGEIIGAAAGGTEAVAEETEAAATEATADAEDTSITFQTQHGSRHLTGTGLEADEVQNSISTDLTNQINNGIPTSVNGQFLGRTTVNGQTIEYRGYGLPNGNINIGTYYVP